MAVRRYALDDLEASRLELRRTSYIGYRLPPYRLTALPPYRLTALPPYRLTALPPYRLTALPPMLRGKPIRREMRARREV